MPDGAAGMVGDAVREADKFMQPDFHSTGVSLHWHSFAGVSSSCCNYDNIIPSSTYQRQQALARQTLPTEHPCLLPPLPSEQTAPPQEALWRGEGLSGLSTGSVSALLFHPVVSEALRRQPAADIFTSQQRNVYISSAFIHQPSPRCLAERPRCSAT